MRKLTITICFSLLMLAAANLPVIGQIKFPKIPKIGPVLPAQVPTPSSGEQPTNTLQTKGGNYIDDGFTWFEAVSTKDPEIKQTNVYTGWALKSSIRLMGIYPARSAFKIVVSKAGKPVATTRCEAYGYNIPAANPADVSFINADGCWKATSATKDTGNFDVEIIAINGDTDAETSVRKYKIDVLRIDRISGPTTQPVADSPRYVISRHAEAPVSILFLRPAKAFGYLLAGEAQRTANINQVEILYSISPSDVGKNVPNSSLRCSVNGQRLQMPGPMPYADQAISHAERQYEEVYSDRLGAQYKASGTPYRDDIGFRLERLTLPLTYGGQPDNINRLNMKNYPGNWDCSLINNGETYRTWRWKVGGDGLPVKHAEQNGNVNLYMNSYLIDTEIPAGGTALDRRLAPVSASEGLFYGQKWTTAEGRSMAAKVPTKGNSAPVPSNKIK